MADGDGSFLDLLRADARRQKSLQRSRFGYLPFSWWLDPGFVCVALFRVAHAAHRAGHGKLARLVMQLNSVVTGADFHPASRIGPGLLVPSPCATNFSCAAGCNLVLMPQAGIGGSLSTVDIGAGPGLPLLGDDVRLGQFAGINGPFRIGDRVRVAAGGGALRDVAADRLSRPAAGPLIAPTMPEPSVDLIREAACEHRQWRTTWSDWRADRTRYLDEEARYGDGGTGTARTIGAALTNPMMMMLIQRIGHWLHLHRWVRLAGACAGLNRLVFKISAPSDTCIGGGVLIPHLAGLVVEARLGRGVTLYASSICAGWSGGGMSDRPVIGDGAIVGGHGAAIGPIHVGDRARMAPKVQATGDVDDGAEVFSPMARMCDEPMPGKVAVLAVVDAAVDPRAARVALIGAMRGDRARMTAYRRSGGRRSRSGEIAVRLHRHAHYAHAVGHRRRARWAWLANVYLTGADISPASRIGPGLLMPYPAGVAFHGVAGANLTIMGLAGVGADLDDRGELAAIAAGPCLGDDVTINHHGLIHGRCTIASRVRIMPGCNVAVDVAADMTVTARSLRTRRAGAPATVARR